MKITLIVVVLIVGVLLFFVVPFIKKYSASKKLVADARPFFITSSDTSIPVLILGDSTAVGVGAMRSEDTLPGRVSAYIGATSVENYAKSGAVVADLEGQRIHAKLDHYTLILIQIGGNDIIRFHDENEEAEKLKVLLQGLPSAGKVIVLSAGNVGGTTLFPFFLNKSYTKKSLAYHAAFEKVATESGVVYVNLYEDPKTDPFTKEPKVYLAKDGLHLSSEGYGLWFEKVKLHLTKRGSN